MQRTIAGALGLTLLATQPTAQEVSPGYESTPLPHPAGATLTLSSGDVLAFDGASVDLYDPTGVWQETVFTLPGSFFTGCFAVSPDETLALVGESSTGGLYRVDLSARTGAPIASLPQNFDAAFESSTSALVSAATCGFGCGNDLYRVDLWTGATTHLVSFAGASGPVAVAPDGDLFYGTSSLSFPAPAGSTSILRFHSADLTGSPVLDEGAATVVSTGFDGASSLVHDPVLDRLFLAENNFGSGLNRVVAIDVASGDADVLVEGNPFDFLSNLELLPATGRAPFLPYQPADGGRLVYDRTDFFSFDDRSELTSQRPTIDLSGSTTVQLQVEGLPPGGFVALGVCPLGAFLPSEVAYPVGGLPLVQLGLDPVTTIVLPTPLAADGAGAAGLTFSHPSGLVDVAAVQGIVADAGLSIVGSTTAAFL